MQAAKAWAEWLADHQLPLSWRHLAAWAWRRQPPRNDLLPPGSYLFYPSASEGTAAMRFNQRKSVLTRSRQNASAGAGAHRRAARRPRRTLLRAAVQPHSV